MIADSKFYIVFFRKAIKILHYVKIFFGWKVVFKSNFEYD